MTTSQATLTYDGARWVLTAPFARVRASSLKELDRETERALRATGQLTPGQSVRVFMAFDSSAIPQWIRQYAQHYFNRVVQFTG